MTAPIVVGYDASEQAAVAVRWAAGEAARSGRELLVVHAWGFADRPGGGAGHSPLGEAVLAGVQAVADEGAAIARAAAPGVAATGVVGHGSPAQALVDHARDARMLVLGRHGAGWFSGALTGSVATGAVQRASCPVAVVPADALEHARTDVVVVGVDGSAGSDTALLAAAAEAESRGATLRVVTTWTAAEASSALSYWAVAYPTVTPDEMALAHAERVQEAARTVLAERGARLEVSWEVTEGPAPHVLAQASTGADLVVVGARGRGGLAGLLLGSVSRNVVRRSHCPVLVTRADIDQG
ncbi:universal stress protein [Cellulomonas cellasea]|uniref:universal stress protein n=1 Tax=Cellulomonas cellasea TaxID=43670 RepID=UPI0025A3C54C|nr:universal stress protein [Cellulomonas cellasea]MDM8084538.1 universal stress protein [Cellulomonas cellasea]